MLNFAYIYRIGRRNQEYTPASLDYKNKKIYTGQKNKLSVINFLELINKVRIF
jgi:hypothetical protein